MFAIEHRGEHYGELPGAAGLAAVMQ